MKLIIAVLVSTFAFGSAIAQSPETSATPRANATPAAMMKADVKHEDAVERRITDLHSKLKITPEQESKWKDVTDVMHENAGTVRPLIEARKANEATRTAVDDLKSYAAIADAHADGVKKFAVAFEPLYDGMSDAQKKTADALFRKHGHEGAHHHVTGAATGAP